MVLLRACIRQADKQALIPKAFGIIHAFGILNMSAKGITL